MKTGELKELVEAESRRLQSSGKTEDKASALRKFYSWRCPME